MMTVTLTIPTQLVQKHVEKIMSSNGISITNFNIFPKIVYDHGDCDHNYFSQRNECCGKNSPLFVQNIISS
jgi:hypothetical protein